MVGPPCGGHGGKLNEKLIERVAIAICEGCEERPFQPGDCRGNEFRWQDYKPIAQAAITEAHKVCTMCAHFALFDGWCNLQEQSANIGDTCEEWEEVQ